jgi:FlaA1/EpsC-like NDP-sugar epimerase
MVYNRFKGFRKFYFLTLAGILVVLYWIYLGLNMVFFHPNEPYDFSRYLLYQITSLLGLLLASLNASKINDQITRCDLSGSHKMAFRNVVYISVAVLLVLVVLRDSGISRLFLFGFLPILYLSFLVAHRSLPKFLLRKLFSERQQHRVLLVGPPGKAQEMRLWCQQTAELGLDISNFLEHSNYLGGVAGVPFGDPGADYPTGQNSTDHSPRTAARPADFRRDC